MSKHSIYNNEDIYNSVYSVEGTHNGVSNFFKNFTFKSVIEAEIAETNSASVFKNIFKNNKNKSLINQNLNKINSGNITQIVSNIKEIQFENKEEIESLVFNCINKIKKDNDQVRPLIAQLCYELLSMKYYVNDIKYSFKKLLLENVKKDYDNGINYANEEWNKDSSNEAMVLVGSLYNCKVLDNNIMNSIIDDFKQIITYDENNETLNYDNIQNAINSFYRLITCILPHKNNNMELFENIDKYIKSQLDIYKNNNKISKKSIIIFKNIINDLNIV